MIWPSTEPCGTPRDSGRFLDVALVIETLIPTGEIRLNPGEGSTGQAKASFEMVNQDLVIDHLKRS